MGLSFIIVILVAFVVFMFTTEGVSDAAKRVVLGIAVIGILYVIYKMIWG